MKVTAVSEITLMVYSHWLSLGPGWGPAPGLVLCRTFHVTPGPGQAPGPRQHCLHALNKAPFSPRGHVIVTSVYVIRGGKIVKNGHFS